MQPPDTMLPPPLTNLPQIPPLENGDQLRREEFERRYDARAHVRKAELIDGVVYMPSPVRWDRHSWQHAFLLGWVIQYQAQTPGISAGDNITIRLDEENEPQPDAAMFLKPSHGGQVRISPDGFIEGAPEWIGEVSASSASIDLNKKFHVYRNNRVLEYLVWRVLDQTIDWFILGDNGQYDRLTLDARGIYQSRIFPGLWLDQAAMVCGDMARVLQVLHEGIAAPEHAVFVADLENKGAQGPSTV